MNAQHVLVIGGGGYIGSMLTRMLLEKGCRVRVLDKFLYGTQSLEGIQSDRLEVVHGETKHIEVLTEAIKGIDAVVHLAELVGDPMCAMNPQKTLESNYFATSVIGSMCKFYGVKRLVYVSSCSVYGASEDDTVLLHEKSALNPVSLYAETKFDAEQALREMSTPDFAPTILRLSTVFGLSYRPRFDIVVNLLTAKAIREGVITIFGGQQWRPNIHVQDAARAMMLMVESPLEKVAGEIFNVGGNNLNYQMMELGQIIHEQIPTAEIQVLETDVDQRNYRIDFTKIRSMVGFEPEWSIAMGVQEMVEALQDGRVEDHKDVRYNNAAFMKTHEHKV